MVIHSHQTGEYVADVVTRIHKSARWRLFLAEHRKAKGVTADQMAGRLGIARESLYRLEREARTRLNPDKQAAYAEALGIAPEELWRPPGTSSLDALIAEEPEDRKIMIADIVRRLIAGRR